MDFGLAQKAPVPLYESNKSLTVTLNDAHISSSGDKENRRQIVSSKMSSLGSCNREEGVVTPLSPSQKLNKYNEQVRAHGMFLRILF